MTDLVAERAPVALEARGMSKYYGATHALESVSIQLRRGHVTALAGGNGAGKSTLIRLLTGVESADKGELLRDGSSISLSSPSEATDAGIFCVYQDQPFVGGFEVYRQMYLGHERHFQRHGVISDSRMRHACTELLEELELSSIAPTHRMKMLSPAARELVALAGVIGVSRILEVEHPVILLDEPTSALSAEELDFLTDFLKSLKSRAALLFVSHRVTEVVGWSDAIYILRDGRNADFMTRETASAERVHHALGGDVAKELQEVSSQTGSEHLAPSTRAVDHASTALAASGVRLRPQAPVFDFDVRAGEIVGLAGVEGSGKEKLLRLLAGIKADDGSEYTSIEVEGERHNGRLRELLSAGVVYLSGERQRDGIFARLSITENTAISRRIVSEDKALFIREGDEQESAERMVSKLSVKTSSVGVPIQTLSGGNQQKVLIGRCLLLQPRVMLLDNVTRGVDIGAKETIYGVLSSLAAEGVGIVLSSDDLDELTGVSDRVIVFKLGQVVREFGGDHKSIDQAEILAAMV